MTTATLEYLNRAVNHSLKESPTPRPERIQEIMVSQQRRVAGLLVRPASSEEAAQARAREELEEHRSDYHRACTRLGIELGKHQVQPICFVPKTAWEQMCDRAGLYRMIPDSQGRVGVNLDIIRAHTLDIHTAWAILVGILASIGAAYWLKPASEDVWGIVAVVGLGITALLAAVAIIEFHNRTITRARIRRLVGRLPRKELLDHLLRGAQHRTSRIAVELPPAPPEVQDTLSRIPSYECGGPQLQVAADGGALSFPRGLENQLGVVLEAERAAAWDAWWDPIVYLVSGPAVAIIAQFGDFPLEREVIDQALQEWYGR